MSSPALDSLPPIIHIGPPKTATTSLQESVIPLLGQPYQIKPGWTRSIARKLDVERPPDLPAGLIISDERLGGFYRFPAKIIANRLAQSVAHGTILFVKRDPVALFYSLYRQGLNNAVEFYDSCSMRLGRPVRAASADEFFDHDRRAYRMRRIGFFAIADSEGVRRAFARHFTFKTIEFNLLASAPPDFVAAFADACGVRDAPPIAHVNRTARDVIVSQLSAMPRAVLGEFREEFERNYQFSRLSPDREDFIRSWKPDTALREFAKSFQFRR